MNVSCPECGALDDQIVELDHQASDWGYAHIDRDEQCLACHATWTVGEPQGTGPERDLECPRCEDGLLLPHKIDPRADPIHADMKCTACGYWTAGLQLIGLDNGEYAFGYPGQIGRTE